MSELCDRSAARGEPALSTLAGVRRGRRTRRPEIYAQAERDYLEFLGVVGAQARMDRSPSPTTLEWNEPFARWFGDGKLNVSVNCLDRHVRAGRGEKIAYYFEGEPGDRRTITYRELLDDVNRFANGLRNAGHSPRRSRRDLHADDSRASGRACWRARASAPRTR